MPPGLRRTDTYAPATAFRRIDKDEFTQVDADRLFLARGSDGLPAAFQLGDQIPANRPSRVRVAAFSVMSVVIRSTVLPFAMGLWQGLFPRGEIEPSQRKWLKDRRGSTDGRRICLSGNAR